MIVGVGIDVVDIERFGQTLERTPALRERLFTPAEREARGGLAGGPVRRQGGPRQVSRGPRGHGVDRRRGREGRLGKPSLRVSGTVAARADSLGVESFHLSLSHDAGIASAVVVAER